MNERVKVFNTKMEKTLASLEKELQTNFLKKKINGVIMCW